RGGEDQRGEREAVLADDHYPIAGTNIIELEDERSVCDGGRQFRVGPGDIALHQGGMVRGLARERLDDIADPVRQPGPDLLGFMPRRRPAHALPMPLVAQNDGSDNRYDFKLSIREPCVFRLGFRVAASRGMPHNISPYVVQKRSLPPRAHRTGTTLTDLFSELTKAAPP